MQFGRIRIILTQRRDRRATMNGSIKVNRSSIESEKPSEPMYNWEIASNVEDNDSTNSLMEG